LQELQALPIEQSRKDWKNLKILADIFPAHLQVAPANTFSDVRELNPAPAKDGLFYVGTTRTLITEENDIQKIVVAVDSPDGAQIIFLEELEEALQEDKVYRAITKSGKMLAFTKDTNCGCGSRLRAWNPYRTLNSIRG
jgi:hypothetical protein